MYVCSGRESEGIYVGTKSPKLFDVSMICPYYLNSALPIPLMSLSPDVPMASPGTVCTCISSRTLIINHAAIQYINQTEYDSKFGSIIDMHDSRELRALPYL